MKFSIKLHNYIFFQIDPNIFGDHGTYLIFLYFYFPFFFIFTTAQILVCLHLILSKSGSITQEYHLFYLRTQNICETEQPWDRRGPEEKAGVGGVGGGSLLHARKAPLVLTTSEVEH